MFRRTLVYAVFVAMLAALGFALAQPAQSATAPVRIMPLGDSITASPGCWRAILWHDLQTNGYTNVDFVGSILGNGCNYGYSYDPDNEGHAGYLATNIANQNQLPGWLSTAHPDVVLMHLGTNDVWSHLSTSTILAAYTKLVGQMRASNPNMKILVAQILPMNPSGCSTCASGVISLDQAIPGWAAGLTTAQSPITVVDQWTGFNDATDTIGDGVHPNDTGFQKMAARWYPPLAHVLDGLNPQPSPSTSVSSSTSASPSPSSGASGALHAVGAGKCLDVPGQSTTAGTQLEIWDCNGGVNQVFTHTSSGALTVYSGGSQLCLDAYNNQTSAGTKVETWTCNGGANQRWNLNANGTITGAQSGLCLDVTSGSTASGALVELWTCTGGSNQQWKLG